MVKIKFLIGCFLALTIISCGDDDPALLTLRMETTVGQEALVHGTTYNINDVDVQFTNVAFYVGDLTMTDTDGMTYSDIDRYHLIRPEIVEYNLTPSDGAADKGNTLNQLSFIIGVDADTNLEEEVDFTMRATDDPLGQQNPTMHWGWQGGYRFMNIDANADLDGDGEFETPLTYHLGKSDFLGTISMTIDEELESGDNEFRVLFDVEKFLSGVDFNTEQFTKTQPDNISIAEKLIANYNSAVSFE